MKKTALAAIIMFILFLTSAASLFCAAGAESQLAGEIDQLRVSLAKNDGNEQKKHDTYAKLGRILNLSGDNEGAAAAWMGAAYAQKDKRDDAALLEAASCYMAMGEWDKADANVKTALLTARGGDAIVHKARYLAAQIEAFKNDDTGILEALAEDPAYKALRPGIYVTLWKLTGKAEYLTKLDGEFPASPESAALSAGKKTGPPVIDAVSSPWFLFSGLGSRNTESAARSPDVKATGIAAPAPSAAAQNNTKPEAASRFTSLQTGLFSSKDNASRHAATLRKQGFTAQLDRRALGQNEFWAVTVPVGDNIDKTILALKNAGYEAFPVY